jgi:hypothetical protein
MLGHVCSSLKFLVSGINAKEMPGRKERCFGRSREKLDNKAGLKFKR